MASKIEKASEGTAELVTQDAPTAPRARDAQGFELDEDGLPIAGPERQRRLAEAGLPDPLNDRAGYARAMKEQKNG